MTTIPLAAPQGHSAVLERPYDAVAKGQDPRWTLIVDGSPVAYFPDWYDRKRLLLEAELAVPAGIEAVAKMRRAAFGGAS